MKEIATYRVKKIIEVELEVPIYEKCEDNEEWSNEVFEDNYGLLDVLIKTKTGGDCKVTLKTEFERIAATVEPVEKTDRLEEK